MARTGWMQTLGSIGSVLTVLVLLAGLIVALVTYFKGKSKVALIGAIGFLILFLFGCCSTTWGLADGPIVKAIQRDNPVKTLITYYGIKAVVLFLAGLLNLVGLGAIVAAVVMGSKKPLENKKSQEDKKEQGD